MGNSIVSLVCLVFAFVLFTIAAFNQWRTAPNPAPYFPSIVCAGLAFWVLASLLPMIAGHQ